MVIEKKTWPEYFQKILDGEKTYEVRVADFECNSGDTIVLKEWDPKTKDYTGREIAKTVGYVLKTKDLEKDDFWPKEDVEKFGLQIMGLK